MLWVTKVDWLTGVFGSLCFECSGQISTVFDDCLFPAGIIVVNSPIVFSFEYFLDPFHRPFRSQESMDEKHRFLSIDR